MKQDSSRNAAYTVDCEDYVHVVEFNPFECGDAGTLIAYGGNNYVVVGTCTFQEEEAEVEGIQYRTLRTFHHGLRVDAIAWSPETRLDTLPPVIKVWDLEGNQKAHFVLRSPGMSVCWHPEEACKLMVAEKNGTIRFYDLITQQAILSLESEQMPLMSAHWCLRNTFKVGAVAGNDWLIWDITRSSYPQDKRPVHMDRAHLFRWSTVNENLFATTGYPGKMTAQLLIHHLGHPQPILIGSAAVGSGLSWHRTLPLCAMGGDHKLLFWVTEM
ncbi:nucleoporin Nup37 isoform X2 [Dromiciops gliroides]|uniref:nucleoporin Nup37 isoform X2 n=1 Tax=Dromiciops gliroides TaxID=33562 RepID=UPI001CC3D36A|nr:nucleoporin Nup37 isoform X2 [Dromiciops gliroides]